MARVRSDRGFTLVELMVTVLIIGVLVAIAIPVFGVARERSQARTCFANQRILSGAVQSYSAEHDHNIAALAGVVDGTHPLVGPNIFHQPPRCPAAPAPADIMTVDVAHGAYTVQADGSVLACGHGAPAHGSFIP